MPPANVMDISESYYNVMLFLHTKIGLFPGWYSDITRYPSIFWEVSLAIGIYIYLIKFFPGKDYHKKHNSVSDIDNVVSHFYYIQTVCT